MCVSCRIFVKDLIALEADLNVTRHLDYYLIYLVTYKVGETF